MDAALSRHDAVLEQEISAHDGRVFAWTGDGCCAVFPGSGPALTAAIALQAVFRDEFWNTAPKLSLRVALHAGPARRRRKHDFVGATLSRVARLLDHCAGDQILATADVIRSTCACAGDTRWRSLGPRTLRGIQEPVEIFDVGVDPLATHTVRLDEEVALSLR